MKCPNCGEEGVPSKTRPRKTDGRVFDVFECRGECKNDKGYKLSWFPPKKTGSSPQSISVDSNNRIITLLEEIKSIVLLINSKTVKKMPEVNLDADPVSEEEEPF
jgi:hypothetical protein